MKKIVLVILTLLFSATLAAAGGVKALSSKEAKALIDKTPNLYILDVRTPDEYKQVRLKNSVLIPNYDLEKRVREVPKNRPLLVVCAVGARSAPAADFLAKKGYAPVYHLTDGLVGWYRNGLPVER